MSKGLDQILAKIKNEPQPTLVNRYLALIAELPEAEKSERALALAQHFVEASPDEALRIARMVHQEDSASAAPFDIMIAAMNAKGRYAKAEVLRIEKEKRVKAASGPKPAAKAVKLAKSGDDAGEEDISQMTGHSEVSLDIGDAEAGGGYNDALDFLFDESGVDQKPVAEPVEPAPARAATPSQAAVLKGLEGLGAGPLDTVLPQGLKAAGSAPVVGSEAPTVHLGSLTQGAHERIHGPGTDDPLGGLRWSEPAHPVAPYVAQPRELTYVELFDHYWRQGFFNEARDLLSQTLGRHGHEAWWQARQAQVIATFGEKKPRMNEADRAAAAGEKSGPMAPDAFWRPIYDEMARLTAGSKALLVPHAETERLTRMFRGSPRGHDLPEGFVKAIQEIDLRTADGGSKDGARVMALLRDLISALWGGAPDRSCADVLVKLDAAHRDPGLWGFYLDGLIAGGAAHQALADIRRTLDLKPKFEWARAAHRRLPAIWHALRSYGFQWQEEEGIAVLRERLAARPRPKLAAMIVARRDAA
jgi:hypothetical protein